MEEIRLQKFLAEAGIASRRKCEELIANGRVKINGKIAKLGSKVIAGKDYVLLDEKPIKSGERKVYILLNKPVGYVTTASDQFKRRTVMDLIDIAERIVPARKIRYVYI